MITMKTFRKMNDSLKMVYFIHDKGGKFVETLTVDYTKALGLVEQQELINAGAKVTYFCVMESTGELYVDVTI